jgi:hypothetical protein
MSKGELSMFSRSNPAQDTSSANFLHRDGPLGPAQYDPCRTES